MTFIQVLSPEGIRSALEQAAIAQRLGQVVCWIDLDHSLDISLARRLGVEPQDLLVSQPESQEQAQEIASHLEKTGVVSLMIVR